MTIREFCKASVNFKVDKPGIMVWASEEDFDNNTPNWAGFSYDELEDMPEEIWNAKFARIQFGYKSLMFGIKSRR